VKVKHAKRLVAWRAARARAFAEAKAKGRPRPKATPAELAKDAAEHKRFEALARRARPKRSGAK
jgi:hypothetical protein